LATSGRLSSVEPVGAKGYSGIIRSQRMVMVRRAVALILLLFFVAAPLTAAGHRSEARAQVEFGISVAMQGLWKEAIYRWQKAIELDPTYAAAFNDLAIAYEHEGLFDKAKEAYEQAMKLDPKNIYIKQNVEYFREINDRAKSQPPR
jgi:Flp pilus assembly protein TadD